MTAREINRTQHALAGLAVVSAVVATAGSFVSTSRVWDYGHVSPRGNCIVDSGVGR